VPGRYLVAVEAGGEAGAYRLSVDALAAGRGVEWEPNEDPSRASELLAFRDVRGGAGGDARELGRTVGRGWWSSDDDEDCFAIPARFRGGIELAIDLRPPAAVTPRARIWDAIDAATGRRRLLAAAVGPALGTPLPLTVGTWSWKAPLVACVSAAHGQDRAAAYRIEVRALTIDPEQPVEIEPNDERRKAQHVRPSARVRGHLGAGDVDRFVLEPPPDGAWTATVAPRSGPPAQLVLLDADGGELAHAQAADAGAALRASGVVSVVLRTAPGAGDRAGDTAYELTLAAAARAR